MTGRAVIIVDEFTRWDDPIFSYELQPYQMSALDGLDVIAPPEADSALPRHRRGHVKHGRKARRSR